MMYALGVRGVQRYGINPIIRNFKCDPNAVENFGIRFSDGIIQNSISIQISKM